MFDWFARLLRPQGPRISRPQLPYWIKRPEDMHVNPVVWTHPDGFVIRNGPDIYVVDLDTDSSGEEEYCTWRREQGLDCLWGPVVFSSRDNACRVATEQKISLQGHKDRNQERFDKWLRDQQHVSQPVACCG